MHTRHQRRVWLFGIALLVLGGALAALGLGIGSTGFESLVAAWRDPVALRIVW
ncbi:MAG: iron ABC transporter permease, partial [Variovorax paradoxus]|nr:iron ABC transporter permease [Variovorax paradoxus]